ncbi:hypothetical protein ANN_09712 [Periplaneta americana]|uniref:Uncharacterized protein n=1 Tax=Periplaneta americana TaxID=6978 RepID=A0ABQ8TME4_PERAM|nr:hypothetical protein ANN_09712 [Periplaneta americana]
MTPLCTLLKSGSDVLVQTFTVLVYRPSFLGYNLDLNNFLEIGENPQTIKKNTGMLLESSKEIGLEVNPENTKYMTMFRDQNIVRNRSPHLWSNGQRVWPRNQVARVRNPVGTLNNLDVDTAS